MVTCPHCGRFVRVDHVEVWWLSEEIKRVDATCSQCGAVDALFTDYDELVPGETPEHAAQELAKLEAEWSET